MNALVKPYMPTPVKILILLLGYITLGLGKSLVQLRGNYGPYFEEFSDLGLAITLLEANLAIVICLNCYIAFELVSRSRGGLNYIIGGFLLASIFRILANWIIPTLTEIPDEFYYSTRTLIVKSCFTMLFSSGWIMYFINNSKAQEIYGPKLPEGSISKI